MLETTAAVDFAVLIPPPPPPQFLKLLFYTRMITFQSQFYRDICDFPTFFPSLFIKLADRDRLTIQCVQHLLYDIFTLLFLSRENY
jgi:hypothetical protein